MLPGGCSASAVISSVGRAVSSPVALPIITLTLAPGAATDAAGTSHTTYTSGVTHAAGAIPGMRRKATLVATNLDIVFLDAAVGGSCRVHHGQGKDARQGQ